MPTCAEGVYVANKHNYAQLTNIHYWDSTAGAWSANLIGAAPPYQFLPNPVVAGDLVVFGISATSPNIGPFCSLVFDIETAIVGVTTLLWKYSNAGVDPTAWAQLTGIRETQDNTNADGAMTGVAFDTTGVGSVHWEQEFVTFAALNPQVGVGAALGITGYWVCAHVTVVPGVATPPTQQNRDIYSILWPYVEVAADDIGGDLPAIPRIVLRNQSDDSVDSASDPALWHSNIVVGRRSLVRQGIDCSDFSAYLNASDVQMPSGVTFTADAPGAIVADNTCATGRAYQYAALPVATTVLGNWDIAAAYAPQYYGTYHAYLIAYQEGGVVDDVTLELNVGLYDGDLNTVSYGPFPFTRAPWRFDIIDFGQVTLASPPTLLASEEIDIWISLTATATWAPVDDITIYTLVLMPVDEWAGEYTLVNHPTKSAYFGSVGWRGDADQQKRYLDIDGYGMPRASIRALCKNDVDNEVVVPWDAHGPPPRLLPDVAQRLWFFSKRLGVPDTPARWRAQPELAASVEISVQQRYSSMRGDR